MSEPARDSGTGARISRPPVYRITVVQLVVLLGLWASLTGWNAVTARSIGLGGLIAVVPNAWFAMGVFRWRGARDIQRAVRAGYAAEIEQALNIKVLDPAAVALKTAEAMADLGLTHSKVGLFAAPPQKEFR